LKGRDVARSEEKINRDRILAAFRQIQKRQQAKTNQRHPTNDDPLPLWLEPGPAVQQPSLPEQWIDQLESVADSFPDRIADEAFGCDADCNIQRVYGSGELQGIWSDGRTTFELFALAAPQRPAVGCNCPQSKGRHPCTHTYEFVEQIIMELKSSDSPLNARLRARDFTAGQPDRTRYEPDPTDDWLHRLDVAIAKLPTARPSADHLPPLKTSSESRIAWRFQMQGDALQVRPILQQAKKRGNGFTKGRTISLENFFNQPPTPLSTTDRQLQYSIRKENDHYRHQITYRLSPIVAMDVLAEADNAYWNETPIQIKRVPLEFGFGNTKNGMAFFIENNPSPQSSVKLFIEDQTLAWFCSDYSAFHVCDVNAGQIEILRTLLSFDPLPGEHLPATTTGLQQLQQAVSLRLPEKVAGPVVDDTPRLAILLRSLSDGGLDFSMRVRDGSGTLRLPGTMPSYVPHRRKGQLLQLHRNLPAEIDMVQQFAEQFQLQWNPAATAVSEPERFSGRLIEHEDIFTFIERLQADQDHVEVLWDRSSQAPVQVLGTLSNHNVRVEITRKRDWFGISGEVEFQNTTVPLSRMLEHLAKLTPDSLQGDFVRLGDGQWARISQRLRERLQSLNDAIHTDRQTLKLDATAAPMIRDLQEDEIQIKAVKTWQKCMDSLARAEDLDPQLPAGIQAELRDYQLDGFNWMRRLAEWGVGGILADDMGLGKTLQTLAVLLDRRDIGPSLVIAPTSVGFNWVREAERFTPELRVHLYRETDREQFLPHVGPGDLIVCSYGLALRDQEALGKVEWGNVVLDEAQAIKNSRSKTSRAIFDLPAKWTVALTGTPVENHLGELWSLFRVVSPGVFGSWESFRSRYASPIEKQNDETARRALSQRLQPFVLRRTKAEVLSELPPRTEMNLYVDLSAEERAEYDRVRMAAIGEAEQLESLPDAPDNRFKILALLTRLRQIACHVGLVNPKWSQPSAKLKQLCETLSDLKAEGHRVLIFSQFTSHLALIRQAIEAQGVRYEYLDGSTPAKTRQACVDRFQTGDSDAFLISLKAGGTGLNLTAADYVIHMDPWWNPAVEDQATDRAHRMGQDKPVMVYRIIARNTIEEEILALHQSKRDLVSGVMDGTQAAAKLTNADLIRMLRG